MPIPGITIGVEATGLEPRLPLMPPIGINRAGSFRTVAFKHQRPDGPREGAPELRPRTAYRRAMTSVTSWAPMAKATHPDPL